MPEHKMSCYISQEDFRNEFLCKYILTVAFVVFIENVDTVSQTMMNISIGWNLCSSPQAVDNGSHMVAGYSYTFLFKI